MAKTGTEQRYEAVFERTEKKSVDGQTKIVTDPITDPNDPRLVALVDAGKRGYLRVTDGATGERIHGMQLSARAARDIMRACVNGKYDPFPKIRSKRREMLS